MTSRTLAKMYREQGFTYQEIGEKMGISKQRVAQILGAQDNARFQPIGENCIYPNLRAWMNKNKVSRVEFIRRMGYTADSSNASMFSKMLQGKYNPKKPYIDKMLKVTGLTYEILFEVIDSGN